MVPKMFEPLKFDCIGEIVPFSVLREENSSEIPTLWIFWSINACFILLSTNHIALSKYKPVGLELYYGKTSTLTYSTYSL